MANTIKAKDLVSGVKGMSESEMFKKFEEFLKKVESDGYKIVPTISAFADSIEQPRADVHEWFRVNVTASKQMRDMCADTIASGAMLKKYVPNVTNFALKNWCGWEEAPQKKGQKGKTKADERQAETALDEYIAARQQGRWKVV